MNIAKFIRDMLGLELDEWQLEVLEAWDEGHPMIYLDPPAVSAGKRLGDALHRLRGGS